MTSTSAAAVPLPTVEDSWARIDAWLSERAPASYALLRPPASPAEIADAERRLEVTFPPDLVASLRCHNGVVLSEGAPAFAFNGPFSGLTDIVNNSLFLRSVGDEVADEYDEEEDESELNAYWRHEWLLITQGVARDAQDGLFVTCRAGENYGRIGRYFNEDAPSFTGWTSLRAALSSFAEALERRVPVGGRVPLAFDGALIWEEATPTVKAEPVSLLGLAARTPEPEPAGPAGPTEPARGTPPAGWSGALVTSGLGKPWPQQVPQPDLVFAEGLSAEELLLRVGVVERETVRERTHAHAERAARSLWAASRPLVRAGLCGDWGFLTQSAGTKQLTRPEVLRRLARGTRIVTLTKQGPEVRLTVYADGLPYAQGAEDRVVSSPREDYVRLPDGTEAQALGVDPWPGSTAAYADFLTELRSRFGIDFSLDRALAEMLPSGLVLPVLEDLPEWSCRPGSYVRHFDLGALVERTPAPLFRTAMAAQLRRLIAETGLDGYPEISQAMTAMDRGETPALVADEPLDVRMRTLAAEAAAARPAGGPTWQRDDGAAPLPSTPDDFRAWQLRVDAADALRRFLLLPVPVAATSILHHRLSEDWRSELARDLDTATSTVESA